MGFAEEVENALDTMVQSMSGGGEERSGQRTMAGAVAETFASGGHLVIQAGTGTGKTLAYLLPAAMSGKRTVVATFTKALQDQMVETDLPMVRDYIRGATGEEFSFAEVKGWSNYLCRERVDEIQTARSQGQVDGMVEHAPNDQVDRILAWSSATATGDKAELDFVPDRSAWSAVSVSSDECLGISHCPFAPSCFPSMARKQAADADVSVANHALYALDLRAGGHVLGAHEVVVLDEAHQIEESFTSAFGFELTGGRFRWLANLSRRVLGQDDRVNRVLELGDRLVGDMEEHGAARVHTGEAAHLAESLALAEGRIEALLAAVAGGTGDDDLANELPRRRRRLLKAGRSLLDHVQSARRHLAGPSDSAWVGWIDFEDGRRPSLKFEPVAIGEELQEALWTKKSAILTSATIPSNIVERLGLAGSDPREEDVGSSFDYENQTLLYCASHLADPALDRDTWMAEAHEELESLILAAGGRTLALFTSYAALRSARAYLREALDLPVLDQWQMPERRLVDEFTAREEACLLATRRFWQGIDVPGPTLSLVVIDRLPFPSPYEYLVKAWSGLADPMGWWKVELPIAVIRLAQGAGRLIRKADDSGVVAVLDPRLVNGSYKPQFLSALPPMARTTDREEAERFLRRLRDG